MMMITPLAHLEAIDRDTLNRALLAWGHKMGPWERPEFESPWFHGLRHNGELIAVTAAASLIRAEVCRLNRGVAIELGRLCAARPHLCRAMLRLWRELIFPTLGYPWVISYQDAVEHSGNTYRFDGWAKLGTSSSGSDARSGKRGRKKVIWGWRDPLSLVPAPADAAELLEIINLPRPVPRIEKHASQSVMLFEATDAR